MVMRDLDCATAGDRLRRALDEFIAEVIEDHVRERLVREKEPCDRERAADELIGIVHSYLMQVRKLNAYRGRRA
jgi:hypothetical protein